MAFHLLSNGDKQDSGGGDAPSSTSSSAIGARQQALSLMCRMNPGAMARVRSRCVETCRMPSLALHLTCVMSEDGSSTTSDPDEDGLDDLVGFVSGLLLGSDPQIRSWISFFIR